MSARSRSQGHAVIWVHNQWVYADTGEPLKYRPCRMCNRQLQNVLVKIPADISGTGFARFKYEAIDACIAPLVEALQKGAVDMRGSCCGHGKRLGEIHLQDGRVLIIADYQEYHKHYETINNLLLPGQRRKPHKRKQ